MSLIAAKPFRIVLLGPPASGKGTQGRRLAESLSLGYLSTGALLREQVESQTPLGKKAAPLLERGEYLPDEIMCPILGGWLARQTTGWVLDGFPRSLPQAEFLTGWLSANGQELDAAVSLEVPFEELMDRMLKRVECPRCRWTGQLSQLVEPNQCPICGAAAERRADDEVENFRRRYAEFQTLTAPVISYYGKQGNLHPCDASAPPEVVAAGLYHLFSSTPAA